MDFVMAKQKKIEKKNPKFFYPVIRKTFAEVSLSKIQMPIKSTILIQMSWDFVDVDHSDDGDENA